MRKPKLTYDLVEKAVEMKSHGLSNADICRGLGVSETAFYNWLREPDNRVKLALVDGLRKAEAEYKEQLLQTIWKAASNGPQTWTAAAWLLERKYPDEFGQRQRREEAHAAEAPRIVLGVEVKKVEGASAPV